MSGDKEKKLPAFLKTVYLSNREIRLILAGLYSLGMSKEEIEGSLWKKLLFEKQIPIEICPTSNTMNLELNDLSEHPKLGIWLKNNYPISFNTDDSVLFNTTLTKEYYNVAKTFNLNEFEIEQLCRNVWDQIFDVNVKHEMMMKNNNNNISRY